MVYDMLGGVITFNLPISQNYSLDDLATNDKLVKALTQRAIELLQADIEAQQTMKEHGVEIDGAVKLTSV
jgi:hypothetical protein